MAGYVSTTESLDSPGDVDRPDEESHAQRGPRDMLELAESEFGVARLSAAIKVCMRDIRAFDRGGYLLSKSRCKLELTDSALVQVMKSLAMQFHEEEKPSERKRICDSLQKCINDCKKELTAYLKLVIDGAKATAMMQDKINQNARAITNKSDTDIIKELANEGMEPHEIAMILSTDEDFVRRTIRA